MPQIIDAQNPSNLLNNTQALTAANASKTDRKLYIGNLPPGIAPPTVRINKYNYEVSETSEYCAVDTKDISSRGSDSFRLDIFRWALFIH